MSARLPHRSPFLTLYMSVVMGVVLWVAVPMIAPFTSAEAPLAGRAAGLAGLILAGLVVYFGIIIATGTLSVRQLRRIRAG